MPKPDDTVIDDDAVVTPVAPPSLDQVHAASQAKIEDEDLAAGDDDGDDTPDDDTTGDDVVGDDATPDDDDVTEDPDEDVVEDPAPIVPEPVAPVEDAVEPNEDITKPGEGKVAIKDSEGTVFYFNSLEEVPDSFEPLSYKALMVGTRALLKKEDADEAVAQKVEADRVVAARQKEADDLEKAWEDEATTLVRSGDLPNEPKKLEAAKEEVYQYIEDEMKKGNIITSFSQAYKGLQFDKIKTEKIEKQKVLNDAKKKRGAIVQGGSPSGDGANHRTTKVIEAPPQGVGLDAVHNRAIQSL